MSISCLPCTLPVVVGYVDAERDKAQSPGESGWLTGVVQVGFVVGTAIAALLNLADVVSARRYFTMAAVAATSAWRQVG